MSVKLASRTQAPVGGFMFFQPQTGKHFTNWSFRDICAEIQAHRKGNPRFALNVNLADIEDEVDEANALRMLSIPGADIFVQKPLDGGGNSPKSLAPRLSRAARNVAGGAKAYLEWSISGEIVDPVEASRRASVCANIDGQGNRCPNNKPGDLLTWFTEAGAAAIRKELELRNDLKLSTVHDANLDTCDACWCPLKVKVWCPMEIIDKHMTDEARAALHPKCWITNR